MVRRGRGALDDAIHHPRRDLIIITITIIIDIVNTHCLHFRQKPHPTIPTVMKTVTVGAGNVGGTATNDGVSLTGKAPGCLVVHGGEDWPYSCVGCLL